MDIDFKDYFTKPERFAFIEKFKSFKPGSHRFLDLLPEPWRSRLILFGYRLGLIDMVGYVKIQPSDENGIPNGPPIITANIIPDVGVTRLRDIIKGDSTELPTYQEFGTGVTIPAVADTDLTTPLAGGTVRLASTVTSPGSFEIRFEVFLNGTYGPTRPYTINEQAVFTHLTTGVIISHAIVSPSHTMTGTNTATATYGLLLR